VEEWSELLCVAGVDVTEVGVPQLSKVLMMQNPSQSVLSCAVEELHVSLQQSVDLMGVGSNVARLDTVAEDNAGLSLASTPLSSILTCPHGRLDMFQIF
jgi:hypothetical protein